MRRMNSIFSRVLLLIPSVHVRKSLVFCLAITACVSAEQLVTTQALLPQLVHATTWSEVEQLLSVITASFKTAQQQSFCTTQELYSALAQDCLEYEAFIKTVMVHTKTQACVCVPVAQQPAMRACGYAYAVAWAKQHPSTAFADFYACYWQIHATLFVYTLADAQVACDAADRARLFSQAQQQLKKLEKSFFYLETSRYDRPYAQLLKLYRQVFAQAKRQDAA